MKIGIMTFHWATNYGAILQAYALQTYLTQNGHDTKIINYRPYTYEKKLIRCFNIKRPWRIPQNVFEYRKEQRLNEFRTKHLNLSKRYQSTEDLKNDPPAYDVYICGSDQIWNQSFTSSGEGKVTLNYFLDFGPDNVKRIAYAASFGCIEYPEELVKFITPILSKFDAVSVREISGRQMVHEMGIDDVWLLPDPTLLLQAKDYEILLPSQQMAKSNYSFFYALQAKQKTIKDIKNYFSRRLRHCIVDAGSQNMSIEHWLACIKSSDFVVTNSFHGVVFAIIFRKPFIVVPIEGFLSGMNDRIVTLLGNLGLQNRILEIQDERKINEIMIQNIEWTAVEQRIYLLRKDTRRFFEKNFL